ncbi:branched-chain amino acid ABC transporter permease [Pseudohalocynthiibacter aestuariivivens]|nr:AzlC family ABC transporter permease [Pseudohalocynthiibacter aestuariivivens]QIE45425.1 branched-chain amino acid ABC transporter permease [Pseudohalocynthiibacter aestuariivivens]
MKQGLLSILPLAAGAALYGFAFGVLAAQVGFPWWGVALMSASVHAGSSQIVAVEQFGSHGFVLGAVLAGAALNLRYLGIIASLTDVLHDVPLRIRLIAIHVTGDENWALTMARRAEDPAIGAAFLLGSGMMMISVWTLSTMLGAVTGSTIPNLEGYGLGFAFTAAFIAMARAMWSGREAVLPWAVTFITTLALVQMSIGAAYAILFGAIAGVAAARSAAITRKAQP